MCTIAGTHLCACVILGGQLRKCYRRIVTVHKPQSLTPQKSRYSTNRRSYVTYVCVCAPL